MIHWNLGRHKPTSSLQKYPRHQHQQPTFPSQMGHTDQQLLRIYYFRNSQTPLKNLPIKHNFQAKHQIHQLIEENQNQNDQNENQIHTTQESQQVSQGLLQKYRMQRGFMSSDSSNQHHNSQKDMG